jgi:hypothetical protein
VDGGTGIETTGKGDPDILSLGQVLEDGGGQKSSPAG